MKPALRFALMAAGIFAASLSPATAHAPTAAPVNARCDVGNAYGESYQGPCIFTAETGGSFVLSRPGNAAIIEDVVQVSVRITRPGAGEAYGRTRAGLLTRWGRANRSKACWRGTDFWICAYALSARPAPGAGSPPSTPGTTKPSPR